MLKQKLSWGLIGVLLLVGLVLTYFGWQLFSLWQIYHQTLSAVETYSQNILQPDSNSQALIQIKSQLKRLETKLTHIPLLPQILGDKLLSLRLLNQILEIISQDQQQIIVLLQNDEELRATGGFMGSYLKISLNQGNITNFYIEDIYQPQGQISAFKEAPPGAREYLSGGEGLKLTDANWQPDFPTSAQEILTLFSLGGETNIDHLIAINSSVLEAVFQEIGPIYLPEFDTTVTAQNFTQLARADRNEFFPGSQQKTIFLNAVLDQLKFKLSQLSWSQKLNLLKLLTEQLQQKNILFYSQNQDLESIFQTHHWAGQLAPLTDNYLYLVESNVGINKANRHVYRQVIYDLDQQQLTIEYHNQNPTGSDQLDYINYLRLILPPQVRVTAITLDQTPVSEWDQTLISNSQGEEYQQIGTLVAIPAEDKKTITFSLEADPNWQTPQLPLLIQKQPGLPPTPYTIIANHQTYSVIVDQDSTITP